jgi:putative FmdB family regulatory protein
MPIYEFKCDNCGAERELILPLSESNKRLECNCGQTMRRKFSVAHYTIPLTGNDIVLKTLNKEDGHTFPGGNKHRARYEQAMAKSLNYERPLEEKIFTGF